MHSKPNFFDCPVNNRYDIRKIVKAGGFGSVYIARDRKNEKKLFAIKIVPPDAKRYLDIEWKLYNLIEKEQFTNGFIKSYQTGEFLKHYYLLMQLVGKDLDDLKRQTKKELFSIKSVLMIGLQAIDRLEAFHKIGYIHRDVKPDNFSIGLGEKNKIIYLFDFGLALPMGSDIPKQEKGRIVGTPGFMSCRAHEGKPQGPPDDIQTLIYTLLYLAEGTLPWLKIKLQSPSDFHKLLCMKRSLSKRSFSNSAIPNQLFQLIAMLQKMKATDKVDYLKIKYLFLEALKKRNQKNDFMFDWCSLNQNSPRLSPRRNEESAEKKMKQKQKKDQKMNEDNQKIVQQDIYHVYKFLEEEKPKKENRKESKLSPPKKELPKKLSPKRNKKEEEIKVEKKRPMSAIPKAKPEPKIMNPWDKILLFQQTNMQSGPKIVINKTAKHKI